MILNSLQANQNQFQISENKADETPYKCYKLQSLRRNFSLKFSLVDFNTYEISEYGKEWLFL